MLPKFGNRHNESPLHYIKELENFFQLRMVPETSKLIMIKNSLFGHSAAWYEMNTDGSNVTYEEFRKLFLEQYWDAQKHAEIRNRNYEQVI